MLLELRTIIHYGMHFILPAIVAFYFYRSNFKIAWIIMILAFVIDLDHLLATPIFDSNRCSIGFHFLHSYIAIAFYALLILPKKTRIIGIGLMLHIITDATDCFLMNYL